jgi:hypothetical protein
MTGQRVAAYSFACYYVLLYIVADYCRSIRTHLHYSIGVLVIVYKCPGTPGKAADRALLVHATRSRSLSFSVLSLLPALNRFKRPTLAPIA